MINRTNGGLKLTRENSKEGARTSKSSIKSLIMKMLLMMMMMLLLLMMTMMMRVSLVQAKGK